MIAIVPDVIFRTRVRDESIGGDNPFRWQDVSTDDIFAGKKIVVLALPGAYPLAQISICLDMMSNIRNSLFRASMKCIA